jgi:hypothetical protein
MLHIAVGANVVRYRLEMHVTSVDFELLKEKEGEGEGY